MSHRIEDTRHGSQEPQGGPSVPRPPLLYCPDAAGSTGRLYGPSPIRAAYGPWSRGEGPEAIRAAYEKALRGLLGGAMLVLLSVNQWFISGAVAQAPPPGALAAERVVRVIDGDTVVLRRGGVDVSCRLLGVAAPELNQPGGPEAAAYLRGWLAGKVVRVSYAGPEATRDRFGRLLANLWADRGRQLVNREIVARGFASVERRFKMPYRPELEAAEAEARTAEVGIWRRSPPEAPPHAP